MISTIAMADGMDLKRGKRYTENPDLPDIFKSKFLNQTRQYYNGELLDRRMKEIRESIIFIRENWANYSEFMTKLQELFKGSDCSVPTKNLLNDLFQSKKDWADSPVLDTSDNFEAIRLYTSMEGYDQIFSVVNRIFRQDDAIQDQTLIRTAVFLVELLNIDLYHYCCLHPSFGGFNNTVYRGMALSVEDLHAFESLMTRPVSERYIAIPLSLMSASTEIKIAEKFFETHSHGDLLPVILKIHVINMTEKYLTSYTEMFSSVVSTICAVDIKDLSEFREENEVLLRGPFFQVLNIHNGDIIKDKQSRVIEMVMLNTNRDHISTMQLGEKSNKARDAFAAMVSITRSEFAIKFCHDNELQDDAEQYRSILENSIQKLARIEKED